jgi:ABC-2 type transport system permease protein
MIPLIRVDLRRAVGDVRLLLVATLFPVLFILVTGILAGNPREPIGLINPSHRLVDLIDHTPDLRARIETGRTSLNDDILRGRVVAGLITLPAHGGRARFDFVTEQANTDSVQARTDVVALLDLVAAESTHTDLTDTTLAHTKVPTALSPFSYVAPADLVLFLGITILVLSSSAVESRRLGMTRRLAAAPVTNRSLVAAQIVFRLCLATGQSLGLLLVGRVIFGVHWGNPFAVALILAFLAMAYSGLSVLIGVWSRTEEQAIALSVVVGIAGGMLGGCMYPLDVVGSIMREVGHVVPQAWAMDAFIKLIYDGDGVTSVLPEIGALAVFAVALSVLATRAYARTMYSPG